MNNIKPTEYNFIFYSPSARIFGYRESRQQRWIIEITLKGLKKVHYHRCVIADEYPNLDWIRARALDSGTQSPRPFVLGQARDVSVRRCAIALAHALCTQRNVDMKDFITQAYSAGVVDFTCEDMLVIIRQAEWEGLQYPAEWGEEEIAMLLRTLEACGEIAMAEMIRRLVV